MQKETVTLSALLTIAVTILGLGVNLIQQGQYAVGAVCIAVGFGVMLLGVYLWQKGIIEKLRRQ
jgi:hypothetical protein